MSGTGSPDGRWLALALTVGLLLVAVSVGVLAAAAGMGGTAGRVAASAVFLCLVVVGAAAGAGRRLGRGGDRSVE